MTCENTLDLAAVTRREVRSLVWRRLLRAPPRDVDEAVAEVMDVVGPVVNAKNARIADLEAERDVLRGKEAS